MSDERLARAVDLLASNVYELITFLRQLTQEVEILNGHLERDAHEKNNYSG